MVGNEMAKYNDLQDHNGKKFAIIGKNITPTPQNISNRQITDFRYFPPVISATKAKHLKISYKKKRLQIVTT